MFLSLHVTFMFVKTFGLDGASDHITPSVEMFSSFIHSFLAPCTFEGLHSAPGFTGGSASI